MSRCIHSRILLTECASESLYSVQNIANIRIRVIFDSSNTLVYRLGTLTDTPLLSCAVCGQGTHDQCISKFLHLTELECRSFTTADAWSRINPTKLPGLHYLCMECTENTIPSEEAGKLKRKTKSTMMDDAEAATTQLQDRGVSQLLDVFTQDNTPGGEDMGTEDSSQTPPQVIENVTKCKRQ